MPPGVSQGLGDDDDEGGSSGSTAAGSSSASGSSQAGSAVGGEPSQGGSSAQGGSSTAGQGGTPPVTGGTNGEAGAEPNPPGGGEGGMAPQDDCPEDPDKLTPGICGCGIPDVATTELSDCTSLKAALIHRYDFEGNGTTVLDRVGSAHGTVTQGATLSKLDGKGVVLLGGGTTGAYVDLPNQLMSTLTNATFEAWVTWGGGKAWQRVFDFGDSTNTTPENNPASGKSYLFASARGGLGGVLTAYSLDGSTKETAVTGPSPLTQTLSQMVVVANDDGDELALYVNGALIGKQTWAGKLSSVNDVNVWLGRSQFSADPELSAVYHEFRMYGAALSAAQVASTYRGGPDPAFLKY